MVKNLGYYNIHEYELEDMDKAILSRSVYPKSMGEAMSCLIKSI